MSRKVDTNVKFGDKNYALVPDRIKAFREDNPRASIETQETYNPDGSITFRATIIKDLADESSARATGSARYTDTELKKAKAFEKLETISIGRALATLGYLNDGKVATTEEMEEFNEYRQEKQFEQIMTAIEVMEKAKDMKELRASFVGLEPVIRANSQVVEAKDKRKVELENAKS